MTSPGDYPWSSDSLYRKGNYERLDLESWEFPPGFQDDDCSLVYKQRMGETVKEWPKGEYYIGKEEELESIQRREAERTGGKYREGRGRESEKEIAEKLAKESDTTVEAMKQPGRSQPRCSARQAAMA